MATTAPNSSRETGLYSGRLVRYSKYDPRAGPSGALDFTGELAADLFEA